MPHKRAKRSAREQNRSQGGHDSAPGKSALSNEAIPKGAARVLNAWKVQEEYNKKRKAGGDGEDHGASQGKRRRLAPGVGGEKNGRRSKSEKVDIKIQPGESLAHFNRRVEESLRPLVRDAIQTSAAVARKVRKEEEQEKAAKKASSVAKKTKAKDDEEPVKQPRPSVSKPERSDREPDISHTPSTNKSNTPKDFTSFSTSAPRRLNDIVQAPPELKKLPRGAKARQVGSTNPSGAKSLKEGVLSMAQKAMLEEERERVIKAYREMKKRNVEE